MLRTKALLLAPALAAALLTVAPTSANASTSATPDGSFWANGSAGSCGWQGNAPDWAYSDNGNNCLNNDYWVWNNGYVETYDQVDVFWGQNYTGAYTCVPQGDSWETSSRTFDHGVGFSGYGETTYNNIASSKWVIGGTC